MTNCPRECAQRRVGCRSECETWAQHEVEKAERYAEAEKVSRLLEYHSHATLKTMRRARIKKR